MSFIQAFAKPERLSVRTQTKISASEKELLDEFVEYCRTNGLDEVTASSAQRTFIVQGLRAWKATIESSS